MTKQAAFLCAVTWLGALAACGAQDDEKSDANAAGNGAGASGAMSIAGAAGAAGSAGSGAPVAVAGSGAGGAAGSAGAAGAAGSTAGSAGSGLAGAGGAGAGGDGGAADDSGTDVSELERFSFFVVSMEAIVRLSGSDNGFGGDLRYGEADGLSGADKICTEVAESSMPGSAAKQWKAFLSVTSSAPGGEVHAIDRIGEGPWYDRLGRIVAMNKAALIADDRPQGADPAIINDLPNEFGVPNQTPDGDTPVDNHHTLTGSGTDGRLYEDDPRVTCQNWTSSVGSDGQPRAGFSWPRGMGGMGFPGGGGSSSSHWISGLNPPGCAAHINIVQTGPPPAGTVGVGSGGGYGGFYCFALSP